MTPSGHRDVFERFVSLFRDRRSAPAVSADALDRAEDSLQIRLPERYREFLCRYGPVFTPKLRDVICEVITQEGEHYDLQQLYAPDQVVTETLASRKGGMPSDLVAVGYDCMGNLFAFQAIDWRETRPADAAVYVFDHDYLSVKRVSKSFVGLLETFITLNEAAFGGDSEAGGRLDDRIDMS